MKLILIGAPGVGKGTQAKRLSEKFDVPHIATGDILREAVRLGTAVGLKAKGFMEAGNLVPDAVMIEIVEERFEQGDTRTGYILDGFPRTVHQAEALDQLLARLGLPPQGVILFECDDEVITARIAGRRTCEKCQRPYHVRFSPPKREDVCDVDGGKLIQRPDDSEAKVRERLKNYRDQTAPLIPYYERRGLLRRVDAKNSPEAVSTAVETVVSCFR